MISKPTRKDLINQAKDWSVALELIETETVIQAFRRVQIDTYKQILFLFAPKYLHEITFFDFLNKIKRAQSYFAQKEKGTSNSNKIERELIRKKLVKFLKELTQTTHRGSQIKNTQSEIQEIEKEFKKIEPTITNILDQGKLIEKITQEIKNPKTDTLRQLILRINPNQDKKKGLEILEAREKVNWDTMIEKITILIESLSLVERENSELINPDNQNTSKEHYLGKVLLGIKLEGEINTLLNKLKILDEETIKLQKTSSKASSQYKQEKATLESACKNLNFPDITKALENLHKILEQVGKTDPFLEKHKKTKEILPFLEILIEALSKFIQEHQSNLKIKNYSLNYQNFSHKAYLNYVNQLNGFQKFFVIILNFLKIETISWNLLSKNLQDFDKIQSTEENKKRKNIKNLQEDFKTFLKNKNLSKKMKKFILEYFFAYQAALEKKVDLFPIKKINGHPSLNIFFNYILDKFDKLNIHEKNP